MKLSIITPCYNSEDFIEEAISSILMQSKDDVELILVDDGSTDNTMAICKKYECHNIRYIKTENLGAGHARNTGIKMARGKWISFLDSDDLYLLNAINDNFFKKLDNYAENNVDIICTSKVMMDMQLSGEIQIRRPEAVEDIHHNMIKMEFWSCIYRTEYINNNNIYFYEYKKQDIETAFRYLAFSRTSNIVSDNDIVFYLQRKNLNSNTHTFNYYNLYAVKSMVFFDLLKNTKEEEDIEFLLKTFIEMVYEYYVLCFFKGTQDFEQSKKIHQLLVEVKKYAGKYTMSHDTARKYKRSQILDSFRSFYLRKPKKKSCKECNNATNQYIDVDTIINRLREVSEKVKMMSIE